MTEDGRYLVVDVNKGCDPTNQLYYFDLQAVDHKVTGKLPLKPLFDKFDAKYDVRKRPFASHSSRSRLTFPCLDDRQRR